MKTPRAFALRFVEARSRFAAINASKAGGDDALFVEHITRGRSEGDRFDLTNAVVIKVPE